MLSRSRYTGPPLRISTSREYVGRALALGFRELAFSNVEQPVVCREKGRIYAWQPLNADSAIEASPDVICIESNASTVVTNPTVTRPRPARSPMNDNLRRNGEFTEPHPASNGKPVDDHRQQPGRADPGSRDALRDADQCKSERHPPDHRPAPPSQTIASAERDSQVAPPAQAD